MNNKIAIIATWSKDIGFGHVKRAEALIHSLHQINNKISIDFFVNDPNKFPLRVEIPDSCSIIQFDGHPKYRHDIFSAYKILIFDVLETTLSQFDTLSHPTYQKKVLICDCTITKALLTRFDLIVNGSDSSVSSALGQKLLLGLDYFIMHPSYGSTYSSRQALDSKLFLKPKLLVTLGGTDHNNALPTLLDRISLVRAILTLRRFMYSLDQLRWSTGQPNKFSRIETKGYPFFLVVTLF